MYKSMFGFFFNVSLGILVSSFITSLGLLLVGFPLRLAINGPYIFPALLMSPTDIVQFDIMLVDTM